jgi:membrane protease YdiL (CAAX protease family)
MATLATTIRPAPTTGLKGSIIRHPLVAYFLLAFAGTWLFWGPLALSREQNGLGLLPFTFPDIAAFAFLLLGGWAGPPLAAITVTALTSGRAGVRQLLRRCVQWRVGPVWYLVTLVGFIPALLAGYSIVYGVNLPRALLAQWPLIFSVYFAALAFSLPTANFPEELGWRGFALPRLQQRYGPLVASVILGTLHGLWHLPVLFTRLLGPTSLPHFTGFVLVAIATTFLYTWIFNHTGGSVLIAALAHGCSNAALGLVATLIPAGVVVSGWARPLVTGGWQGDNVFVFGMCALLVVIFTRGRLGYRPRSTEYPADMAQAPA